MTLDELKENAHTFVAAMHFHFPQIYQLHPLQPAVCVAEEGGEFAGAVRRWMGLARRTGTKDEVAAELADVVISSFIAADVYDIDLEVALADKIEVIFSRGFKEDRAA